MERSFIARAPPHPVFAALAPHRPRARGSSRTASNNATRGVTQAHGAQLPHKAPLVLGRAPRLGQDAFTPPPACACGAGATRTPNMARSSVNSSSIGTVAGKRLFGWAASSSNSRPSLHGTARRTDQPHSCCARHAWMTAGYSLRSHGAQSPSEQGAEGRACATPRARADDWVLPSRGPHVTPHRNTGSCGTWHSATTGRNTPSEGMSGAKSVSPHMERSMCSLPAQGGTAR